MVLVGLQVDHHLPAERKRRYRFLTFEGASVCDCGGLLGHLGGGKVREAGIPGTGWWCS